MEHRPTMWDTCTAVSVKSWIGTRKSSQIYPRMVSIRYTSGVNTVLTQLDWQHLASRQHSAWLLMFYKIHYGLIADPMPLGIKSRLESIWVENPLAYHIPCDYQIHFVSETFTQCGNNITNLWQEIFTPMTLAFSCEVVHEKLWKSVNICKSYSKKISGTFFSGHGVITLSNT